jgi:hypothetical protein
MPRLTTKKAGRPVQYKVELESKACPYCNKEKPINDFTLRSVDRTRGGVEYIYQFRIGRCKECVRQNAKEWQRKNRKSKPVGHGEYDFVFNPEIKYG